MLETKGFKPLPSYMPVPEHEKMKKDEMILTTYKVNVQIHSRSQNCKWITEIYHENPAWINPKSAAERGIRDGDIIKVTSDIGEIVTKAKVTKGVHPGVIAISHHCGHWAYGEYASGIKSAVNIAEPDSQLKWWNEKGVHPNWLIPNKGDPIGGGLTWMDTVVTVAFQSAGVRESVIQQIALIKGWNMVSVGVIPEDNSVSAVFPDALTVYAWENNTYVAASTIECGKAYWVAAESDQTVTVESEKLSEWTRSLSQGWHMIGALAEDKLISDLSPASSILIVYGFNPSSGKYVPATYLESGKGYWVAIGEEANISLSKPAEQRPKTSKVQWDDFLQKFSKTPPPYPDSNSANVPREFKLLQNYPNPFNLETTIKYELAKESPVTIKIHNILGQEIRELVNGEKTAGYYSVKWDGTNNSGLLTGSGVYIYTIKAGNFVKTKKMVLLK